MKISVIGAGNVGAQTAFYLAEKCMAEEIVLIDTAEGIAKGKALDLVEAGPIEGYDIKITGSKNYENIKGSGVVIMTAGVPRKPGMSRMDLLKINKVIVESAAGNVKEFAPDAFFIIVTNPLDIMAYAAYKKSGFKRGRVMGMAGALDSARFRAFIADELNVSVKDVSALVLGGHGDDMVPSERLAAVSGIPLVDLMDRGKIDALIERTRKAGGEIVGFLKTGSAFYSPAASAADMAEAIIKKKNRLITASVLLDGEYGLEDVFCGVPVILGRNGVEKIVEIELSKDEKKALYKSAASVKEGIKSLG